MPVRLSDGSDVQKELRNGQVHCLMWCATGSGWESEPPPLTLEQLVENCSDGTRPRVIIVCLRFGAQRAARLLCGVGAPTVIWLQADMLAKRAERVLCSVVVNVLAQLGKLPTEEAVHAQIAQHCKAASLDGVRFGCVSHRANESARWGRDPSDETVDWLKVSSCPDPLQPPWTNLEHDEPSELLACDLPLVEQLRKRFCADEDEERLQCLPGDPRRSMAIATEVCKSFLYDSRVEVAPPSLLGHTS